MLSESYGKLPLSFEPNQGQTDKRVKFLSRGRGYSLFLTPTEAVLTLQRPSKKPKNSAAIPNFASDDLMPMTGAKASRAKLSDEPPSVLRVRLVRANRRPKIEGIDPLPGKANYFSPALFHLPGRQQQRPRYCHRT